MNRSSGSDGWTNGFRDVARNDSGVSLSFAKELHLLLLVTVILLTPGALHAQSAEGALLKLENDWAQAVIKRDVPMMERLAAPRWVYSDESGVMERAAGIKAFTSGPDTVKEASNEHMRAMVYGSSAVVIGVLRLKGRGPQGVFDHRYRYTDSWVLMDGTWRCVASQDYLIPDKR